MLPRALLLVALCLVASLGNVSAKTYNVKATGTAPGNTPENWGIAMAMGNKESNTITFLKYLNPTYMRIFIQPLSGLRWRKFVGNEYRDVPYGDQFGLDFSNNPVENKEAYKNAVNGLRSGPGDGPFFQWLDSHEEVNWPRILERLSTTTEGITGSRGNPEQYIKDLKANGYDIMALWDKRCNTLDISSVNPEEPEYWKDRWELYRLNYFGGRWFADRGILQIELYNEPDRNPGCMNGEIWVDDVRIRSQAMQDAFADHNKREGTNLEPHLIGPATSVYWRTTYSAPMFEYMKKPFPDNVEDPNFTLFKSYSYHKYGRFSKGLCTEYGNTCRNERGALMRSSYDKLKPRLEAAGHGDMDILLTEFNCFTAATSDNASHPFFRGKHVADLPTTGACLAGQISHLIKNPGGPNSLNIHRLAQNYNRAFPSKLTKNGIMYGSVVEKPFFLTGSTKLGEIFRLYRRKTGRRKEVWNFEDDRYDISGSSFFSMFAVADEFAYYLYITNEEWNAHRVKLKLDGLPDVDDYGNVIATSVGMNREFESTYHGEVAWTQKLNPDKFLNYVHEPSTFMMLTVPKVKTQQLELTPTADATCRSSDVREGLADQLVVSTAEQLAVSIIKFEYDETIASEGIVSAVMRLHLREATNDEPQVMSVLALPDDWHEESVSWSNLIFLKPAGARISKTNENFINWWADPMPSPVGYITIPPRKFVKFREGRFLSLDVTDAVQQGITQFMLVRVFRYDESPGKGVGQLPADNVQGSYFFTSKDNSEVENHPKLFIDYKVNSYDSPPPTLPPSPPPAPPSSPPPSPPPPSTGFEVFTMPEDVPSAAPSAKARDADADAEVEEVMP